MKRYDVRNNTRGVLISQTTLLIVALTFISSVFASIVIPQTSAPVIQVLDGTTNIPDSTRNSNFGYTTVGIAVSKIFTITNIGVSDLTLTPPITVPLGFSVMTGFGSNDLVAGSSTQFTIQFNPSSTGTYAGTISFANNDPLQNPFKFTVIGSATTVGPLMTMAVTTSDGAQMTTLAFDGLAMMAGNMEAQSFFPPGKVADYTGFQYLRDNDPDNMGHNTSFLTRIANNIIYILNDSQFSQLVILASAQQNQINLYGYKRFPFIKAFRRLLDDDIPAGSTGLNLTAVKKASHELYLIDGQITFDRALLYANIYSSMDSTQIAYLDAMKGKGWSSWPDITDDQIQSRMSGLPQGTAVAVMTYASDIFSWYAGSLDADVYFCPERHGTYYGGFYIKDAPAIGHDDYSISEQLTATAGSALCDCSKGYVTQSQASTVSNLVNLQRNNLYAGTTNIVQTRTQIATLLRSLLVSTTSSVAVNAQVLTLSGIYGELDGEDNYYYATIFAQVYNSLTYSQKTNLVALRDSFLLGTYSDGTSYDYTNCTTYFLYSDVITDTTLLTPYIANTDYLFFQPTSVECKFWENYE